ncbi:MAG TPA: T9SS type A sorting domain-containing protein [Paludibacter sp.]|nr:T9SS type A sorting domain-containing protein [Paludibacter sp.]
MKHNLIIVYPSVLRSIIFGIIFLFFSITSNAATGNWASTTTGTNIVYTSTDPVTPLKDASGKYLTIVYLENLGIRKIGGNTNAADVAWLLSQGYRVIELDYANNTKAISPTINADIIAINDAIFAGSFCGLTTCSQYKSYVLFEGYRIARDVSYFKDNPTIYNYSTSYTEGDSLHMDIIYPANATEHVPVVLSFSYSNSYPGTANKDQRLNLGNTLAGFNDSFLEGAPANGIAWAIADHPKYCPWGNGKPVGATNNKAYASYETNPDAAQKVKSAIRTLRAKGLDLGLSGKIGIYGFSRGSDAGSLAVGDKTVPGFENAGLNIGISDDVQVAALGSGVFDFTYIYKTTGDGDSNLETNCPSAWGALASNTDFWKTQGSYYLTETSATAPVIFFYNTDDAAYYQSQIVHFKARLDSLGVPTSQITNYGTGHNVPQTAAPLTTMYDFFKQYLTPPGVSTGIKNLNQEDKFQIKILPNPASDKIQFTYQLNTTGKIEIELLDLSGISVYKTEKQANNSTEHTEIIDLENFQLAQGIYFLKITSSGMQEINKFIKK